MAFHQAPKAWQLFVSGELLVILNKNNK